MAEEKRTQNFVPSLVIYDDAGDTTRPVTGLNLTNATTVDVSIVDGDGNQVTSFGGGTQYDEDTQHTTGDKGTVALVVRNDTLAALAGTDGDYAPLQVNSDGALFVDVADGGVLESAIDGIESVLATIDTDTGNIADTTQTLGSSTPSKAIYVGMRDLAGNINFPRLLRSSADGESAQSGNIQGVMSHLLNYNGTTWDRVRGDTTNGLLVNLGSNNDVTVTGSVTANAGTNLNTSALLTTTAHDAAFGTAGSADSQVRSIQGIASMTPVQVSQATASNFNGQMVGNIAHDGIDSGNPVKVGQKAVALKATPTAVAAADRTDRISTRGGIPFVLGGAPNILSQSMQVTDADGAQTNAAIITVGAGTAIVVTKTSVMADNANTVDVSCRIGFGTTNTPAADAAQVILFHPGIAAGSGVVEGTGAGIIGLGASNEDLRVTCEDPVSGSINIIVTYYLESI